MQKFLRLSGCLLALLLSSNAYAQTPLLLFNAGTKLGRYVNKKASDHPTIVQEYQGRQYPMQRTPTTKLPKQDAELITTLETQLDQCHTALLADDTGIVCSPDQRFALQGSLASLLRARLHWSTEAYQQEMAFYFAEDTRRQQAVTPAK